MSLRLKMTLLIALLLSVSLGFLSYRIYEGEKNQMYDSIQNEAEKTIDWVMENLVIVSAEGFNSDSVTKLTIPEGGITPGITAENAFMMFEIISILDDDGKPLFSMNQGTGMNMVTYYSPEIFENENGGILYIGSETGYPIMVLNQKIFKNEELLGYVQIIKPIQSMLDYQESLKTTLIHISIEEVIICTLIVWLVLGFMLKRVQQATDAADAIRLKHDFSQRVPYKGANDEIGKLSRSLNLMLETLQNSYDQLKNSLGQQRQFVADVSHELRTPLTTINGNLALLRSGKIREEADKTEILEDISTETDRLVNLVGEMLDLARADIADAKLDMENFPLQVLTDECKRQMAVLDSERLLKMEVPENLMVKSNREKLKQLLIILLDNAYKHSEGEVTLVADSNADCVEIRVMDEGDGIAPELIPTIFDRFRRGKKSGSGLGLGLSIAKALTTALHGDIRVESELGQGTSFIVTLPVSSEVQAVK